MSKYYEKNKERIRQYTKDTKERRSQYFKEYYRRNIEKFRERAKMNYEIRTNNIITFNFIINQPKIRKKTRRKEDNLPNFYIEPEFIMNFND
jgi:adenine C2-methylase RlmN of 23S rRNA A2503 and tRNA A37